MARLLYYIIRHPTAIRLFGDDYAKRPSAHFKTIAFPPGRGILVPEHVARKLVIKQIPKGEYKPSPPGKSPAKMALVCAFCVQAVLGGVLALVKIDNWFPMSGGGGPLVVTALDEAMDGESQSDEKQEQTETAEAMPFELPAPDEVIAVTVVDASWSWPVTPLDVVLAVDRQVDDLAHMTIDFDMGNLLPEPQKKRPARRNVGSPAKSESGPVAGTGTSTQLARYKKAPLPPYPKSAKAAGQEGKVILQIHIDEKGNPQRVTIAESSGIPILDEVSVRWVRNNWSFYPAMNNNVPVASIAQAPLQFTLD